MTDGLIGSFSGRKPTTGESAGQVIITDRLPVAPPPVRPADTINRERPRTPPEIRANLAGANSLIPLAFGDSVRMVGMPDYFKFVGGALVFSYTFCKGEIDSFTQLIVDGRSVPITTLNSGANNATGTSYQLSRGSAADAIVLRDYMAALSPGYTSVPETARIGFELAPNLFTSFPRVEVLAKGTKVFDPRTSTSVVSNNPALIMAHLVDTYWQGMSSDTANLIAAADDCDELVNGERRRRLKIVLNRKASISEMLSQLSIYGVDWHIDFNKVIFTHRGTRTTSFSVGSSSGDAIIRSRTGSLTKGRGNNNTPKDVVVIGYDPVQNREFSQRAIGGISGEVSEVQMPGLTTSTGCKRAAVERMNQVNLSDVTYSCAVDDPGLEVVPGMIVQVDDSDLQYNAQIDITSWKKIEQGRYELAGKEYDPLLYSDDVETDPSAPDTGLPDPDDIPVLTGVAMNVDDFVPPDQFRATLVVDQPNYAYFIDSDSIELQIWKEDESELITATRHNFSSAELVVVGPGNFTHYFTVGVPRETSFKIKVAYINRLGLIGPFTNFVTASYLLASPDVPPGPTMAAGDITYPTANSIQFLIDGPVVTWPYVAKFGVTVKDNSGLGDVKYQREVDVTGRELVNGKIPINFSHDMPTGEFFLIEAYTISYFGETSEVNTSGGIGFVVGGPVP